MTIRLIENEVEYREAFRTVAAPVDRDPALGSPVDNRLEALVRMAEQYEVPSMADHAAAKRLGHLPG
jgi:antitoxin component HigA of HigAB toxin-antitoxin module